MGTHNSHMSQSVEDNSHLYAQLKLHGPWIDCTASRKPAPEILYGNHRYSQV